MDQSYKAKLVQINDQLIEEGKAVAATEFKSDRLGGPMYVDLRLFYKWWGKVASFGHQLGTAARPWQEMFSADPKQNLLVVALRILGTLEAIKHELENDHFDKFSQLVRAETLADLLDQAQHLLANGYYLAAGVIGRVVLEEHLRNACDTLGCSPPKQNPTICDFNQALYSIQHYSKTKMKQIDALASVGNDAAHSDHKLDSASVKKLLLDLPEVMESTNA